MPRCLNCIQGFHLSCRVISCECSHQSLPDDADPSLTVEDDDDGELEGRPNSRARGRDSESARGGRRDATLKDQQSTGRKRAARMYPLDRELPCEWRDKANCGGGTSPILGCVAGNQQARHHGPDKSVSNNEPGNVHRICHACHNRWHAANNEEYDWNETRVKPHDPRPMTAEEQEDALMTHMIYSHKKMKAIKD